MSASPRLRVLTSRPVRGARLSNASLDAIRERVEAARLADLRDDAYQAGLTEGRRLAAAELAPAAEALQSAEQRYGELYEDLQRRAGAEALELAVEITRHLLRSQLAAGDYDIEKIVREALAASGVGRGSCTVHLAPVDLERLAGVPFRAGTQLEADPEVPPGCVHVSTAHGLLVRDLDDALTAVAERVAEGLIGGAR